MNGKVGHRKAAHLDKLARRRFDIIRSSSTSVPIISRLPVVGPVAPTLGSKPLTTLSTAIGIDIADARPSLDVLSLPIAAHNIEQSLLSKEARTSGIPSESGTQLVVNCAANGPWCKWNLADQSYEVPVLPTSPVEHVVIADGDARPDDYDSEVEVSET